MRVLLPAIPGSLLISAFVVPPPAALAGKARCPMRALSLPAVTGLLLATALAVPARATVAPMGELCGWMGISDPTRSPNDQLGEIEGGPLVLADLAAPTTPVSG